MSTRPLANLEALLFTSGEPVAFSRLAKILNCPISEIQKDVAFLKGTYLGNADSGLQLLVQDDQVQLVTKGETAPAVEKLLQSALQENLSRAAVEVLAIIAYRAPLTRAEIEAIRGVNCSFTLRNLLLRDLIEREGNPEDGRGYIYRPSFRLLAHLGLGSASDLPDYEALSRDERLSVLAQEISPDNAVT